jgi:hypothetical protein
MPEESWWRTFSSFEQFLEWFPGVQRSQVEAFLDDNVMTLSDSQSVHSETACFFILNLRYYAGK